MRGFPVSLGDRLSPTSSTEERWDRRYPTEWSDGDGTGDNADADDDNDGFSDAEEIAAGTNPLNADSIPIPEPNTALMQGISVGLVGLAARRRSLRS